MPVFAFGDKIPEIDETAFIAPTACIVGDVTIGPGASLWFGTVIRGDVAPVVVCDGANVQDGSVLHGAPGTTTRIGPGATVAHNCVVHGADIGAEALIANGAIVLDGAIVGERSLIAAGSVVSPGDKIPPGVLAAGAPAEVKRPIEGTQAEVWVVTNPRGYQELAALHRQTLRLVSDYR